MLKQLAKIERRFMEIESLLNEASTASDPNVFRTLSKERSQLEECVLLYRQYKKMQSELIDAQQLVHNEDKQLAEMAEHEVRSLTEESIKLESSLRIQLLPQDPNDSRNIVLEIRAGAGGDEASLFVSEMFRMYSRFSERQRWRTEVLSLSENELGGIKEAVMSVQGENVYRLLKYESGVHRVQRVPATEAQGRVHTSTITVAILPEADEVEVTVNEGDLRVDTYRASGAGGQHVNRTDSAVRITHLPTGIVVACQDERSQIKNRSKAMKILKAKLLQRAQEEQERNLSEDRKSQVGRGDRSERIRTYNFPQSRITDHRISYTTHAIHDFMDGDIQEMLQKIQDHYQNLALQQQAEAYQ